MSDVELIPSAKVDGPMVPLLITVFTSILEVFLLCLAGYVLAWRGILDKKTIKQLNRLNIALFTPSLLFSKVAFFLSPEKLKELWVIPIFFVIVTSVSMSVSFLLASIFRVTRSQKNFAMAAAMFMNSNSLPVALMQSLVITIPALKWGPDDNNNAMVGRALTYLLLYSTIGMVLRWSVGWQLLTQSDPENEANADVEETSALVPDDGTLRPARSAFDDSAPSARRSRSYNWFPNSANQSRVQLAQVDSAAHSASTSTVVLSPEESDLESDSEPAGPALPHHVRQESTIPQVGATGGLRRTWRRVYRAWVALNGFMTAPLWAALASIVVACVGPLQHVFKDHMHPVKGALTSAGNCSIPITLIVLGAYFYPPPPENASSLLDSGREKQRAAEKKPAAHPGETKTVVIAVVSRMILTPLLLLPLMALCAKFDFQAVFDDPVFVVATVLLLSSPPALTLAQISQAASGDAFERLISRTIFWAYCIVTPLATIAYAVIGLRLSEL
ncbi:auxin efflux carrier [Mycena sp. CBHHK59/15]|nr:auxin efflux carrier [Mycena sp. CBHHK59/15]